jgi:molybdate transport system regulatory protein
MTVSPGLKIKIQIHCGEEIAMGPGKADLLDAIRAHGSISAAARAMGMSYRRAWLLVDAMNRCWDAPLVQTAPGRSASSGARLTESGERVLAHYRTLQEGVALASHGADYDALAARLLAEPRASQKDD